MKNQQQQQPEQQQQLQNDNNNLRWQDLSPEEFTKLITGVLDHPCLLDVSEQATHAAWFNFRPKAFFSK